MKIPRVLYFLAGGAAYLTVRAAAPVEVAAGSIDAKVDALFSEWTGPDRPGMVCAVMQDGRIVYEKGFGMADLEHDEPLSPDSVFYIASTSKQFTATVIALLVLDGKLSLDSEIRAYLPELQEVPGKVTIGQLVHHTSGIRDYFSLLSMTGWRDTDYFNNDTVVRLLSRQETLNFEPGTQFGYSNSNYVLLAEIVKRATGQSLRTVAQERLFAPLGMKHTHFDDDYRQVVKRRVISYVPKGEGKYLQLLKEFDGYGDGNLLTTVRDLALWDENFYTGKAGGKAFIDLILTKGVLKAGNEIPYAFGLGHGTYRGLATVSHAGGFKGFRTELVRFPGQHFSVTVLSNLAVANPTGLAYKIADICLADKFPAKDGAPSSAPASTSAAGPREAIKIDPAIFDAYVGQYAIDKMPGFVLTMTREGDRFFSQATRQPKLEIFSASVSLFFFKVVDAQLAFKREADGSVKQLTLHQNGEHIAHRITAYAVPPAELEEYPGEYRSKELDISYRIEIENGRLKFSNDQPDTVLFTARKRDDYEGETGHMVFQRDAQGGVTGLLFSTGPAAQDLLFVRRPKGQQSTSGL